VDGIIPMFRLTTRGGEGLCCDTRGVALGPVALVEAAEANGRRIYRVRPAEEIARTLALAYDPFVPDDLARRLSGLEVAARALEAGDMAKAAVATVLLKLPPLSADAVAKLAREPTLKKYSPDQPRDERGRWTSEGNLDGPSAGEQKAKPNPSTRAAQSISDGRVVSHQNTADGSIQVHVRGTDGRTYVYAGLDPSTAMAPGTFVRSGDTVGSILSSSPDRDIQTEPLPPPTPNIPGTDIPDRGIPEDARRRPLGPTPNEHADEGIAVGPPDRNVDPGIDRPRIPQDKITPGLRSPEDPAARKPIRPRLPR